MSEENESFGTDARRRNVKGILSSYKFLIFIARIGFFPSHSISIKMNVKKSPQMRLLSTEADYLSVCVENPIRDFFVRKGMKLLSLCQLDELEKI